jgi:hypothetical protein
MEVSCRLVAVVKISHGSNICFPPPTSLVWIMSSSDSSCYTVVFESSAEYPSASELRSGLEKGSDEVKIDTLRKIIVSTINGNSQVSVILFFIIQYIDQYNHSQR